MLCLRSLPILLGLIMLNGCTILDKIYMETSNTRLEMERFHESYRESISQVSARISAQEKAEKGHFEILAAKLDDLEARVNSYEKELTKIQSQLDEIKYKIRGGSTIPTIPIFSKKNGGTTQTTIVDPVNEDNGGEAVYTKALQFYNTGQFQQAVKIFLLYLSQNPTADHAGDAYYWLGECYDSLDNMEAALEAYETTAERYPAHKNAPAALFRAARIYENLGKKEQALEQLKAIQIKHPNYPQMQRVKDKIKQLNG